MKAAQIKKYGNPDVIEIIETQKPKVDRGQVLIKNYASSINPFDVAVIKGLYWLVPRELLLNLLQAPLTWLQKCLLAKALAQANRKILILTKLLPWCLPELVQCR